MTVIAPPRRPAIHNKSKRRRWACQLASIASGLHRKATPRYTMNRAQRRATQRAKWRKERQEKRREAYFNPNLCPRCALPFLTNPYAPRCQCQAGQRKYRCTCGYDVIATPREWRHTSFCAACADQLREQWENEEASRGEAVQRYYEMQEEDL